MPSTTFQTGVKLCILWVISLIAIWFTFPQLVALMTPITLIIWGNMGVCLANKFGDKK